MDSALDFILNVIYSQLELSGFNPGNQAAKDSCESG
jgi:hypothetical protein